MNENLGKRNLSNTKSDKLYMFIKI